MSTWSGDGGDESEESEYEKYRSIEWDRGFHWENGAPRDALWEQFEDDTHAVELCAAKLGISLGDMKNIRVPRHARPIVPSRFRETLGITHAHRRGGPSPPQGMAGVRYEERLFDRRFAERPIKTPYDACKVLWSMCTEPDSHLFDNRHCASLDHMVVWQECGHFSDLAARLWRLVSGELDAHLASRFITATWAVERAKRRAEKPLSSENPLLKVLAGLPRPALLEVKRQLHIIRPARHFCDI
jgi:hypothetical protein